MLEILLRPLIFSVSFLFVLSMLVFIHEMGHYSVARFFKISVERFSIGFGKPIAKWRAKSGTLWTVGRIPLGGYVKFLGDAGAASNPDSAKLDQIKSEMNEAHGKDAWKKCFHFKPLWQRTLVVLAGPMANFLLAALIYMGIALFLGIPTQSAQISAVTPGSVAEKAGFLPEDEIIAINDDKIKDWRDMEMYITLRAGVPLTVVVNRDGSLVELSVTPARIVKEDAIGGKMEAGAIGVGRRYGYSRQTYSVGQAAQFGVGTVVNSVSATCLYIGRIFQGKENGKALGGIVKIGAITGKAGVDAAQVEGSIGYKFKVLSITLLELAAALSVGLGFANLMPIPVLDGGHLVYYGYEAVMRRPLSERAQEIGFRVGISALLTLFLVLTWNDIGYVADLFNKTG
jgi:regulator of sigma E protease